MKQIPVILHFNFCDPILKGKFSKYTNFPIKSVSKKKIFSGVEERFLNMVFLNLLILEGFLCSFHPPKDTSSMGLLIILTVTVKKNYYRLYFSRQWLKISRQWLKTDKETFQRTNILNWKNLIVKIFDWFHVRLLRFLAKSIRKRCRQIKNFTFSLWIISMHTEAYKYQRKNRTNSSAQKFCGHPLMCFGSERGSIWTVFKTDTSWRNPVRRAPELRT